MIRWKEILLGFLGIFGILCIMEIFIRGAKIVPPSFTDYVEGIGRVRRDNLDFVMFGEGFTINRFNEGRYLGPFYTPIRQQGTIRIAILGDSYVEGFQIFDRHHFRNILEKNLTLRTKGIVEVLNFGRSGFDLEDIVAYDYLMVKDYNPDYVMYFLSNEDYNSSVSDQLVPNLEFFQDSVKVKINSTEKYLKDFIKYNNIPFYFTYVNMLSNCLKQHNQGLTGKKLLGKFFPDALVSNQALISPSIELDSVDLRRIETLLDFSSKNSHLIIVKRDTKELPSHLKEVICKTDVDLIDLTFPLDSLISLGIDPFYWNATKKNGHWNQKAHEAIGNYLTEETYDAIISNQ